MSTITKHRHFGDWLRWKRRGLPAKVFWKGDPRNYYNLEAKAEPGRLSGETINLLAEALKMEPADVIDAWRHEAVPASPSVGVPTSMVGMSPTTANRLRGAAKSAGQSVDEFLNVMLDKMGVK